jgi:hypothetical protein
MKDTAARYPQALAIALSIHRPDAERGATGDLKFTDEAAIPWFLLGRRPRVSDRFQNLMARIRERLGDCL